MKKSDVTQNEIVILNVIWSKKVATLRMIMDAVCAKTSWSKHTIISFLKRMEQKNLIEIVSTTPVKQYKALVSKKRTINKQTKGFIMDIYNGNLGLLVSNMVASEELSDKEINELIDLLESKRRK